MKRKKLHVVEGTVAILPKHIRDSRDGRLVLMLIPRLKAKSKKDRESPEYVKDSKVLFHQCMEALLAEMVPHYDIDNPIEIQNFGGSFLTQRVHPYLHNVINDWMEACMVTLVRGAYNSAKPCHSCFTESSKWPLVASWGLDEFGVDNVPADGQGQESTLKQEVRGRRRTENIMTKLIEVHREHPHLKIDESMSFHDSFNAFHGHLHFDVYQDVLTDTMHTIPGLTEHMMTLTFRALSHYLKDNGKAVERVQHRFGLIPRYRNMRIFADGLYLASGTVTATERLHQLMVMPFALIGILETPRGRQTTASLEAKQFVNKLVKLWFDFQRYVEMCAETVVEDLGALDRAGFIWAQQFIDILGPFSKCNMQYPKLHVQIFELVLQIARFGKQLTVRFGTCSSAIALTWHRPSMRITGRIRFKGLGIRSEGQGQEPIRTPNQQKGRCRRANNEKPGNPSRIEYMRFTNCRAHTGFVGPDILPVVRTDVFKIPAHRTSRRNS